MSSALAGSVFIPQLTIWASISDRYRLIVTHVPNDTRSSEVNWTYSIHGAFGTASSAGRRRPSSSDSTGFASISRKAFFSMRRGLAGSQDWGRYLTGRSGIRP